MGDWQLQELQRVDGARSTNPVNGVTLTSNASGNTKGAYAALDNAPFDATGIVLLLGTKLNNQDYLVDIALGASGSETVVIENFSYSAQSIATYGASVFFPLEVKSGQRVAARFQSATGSQTCIVGVQFVQETFCGSGPFQRFATYGPITTTGLSVALGAPGAGAWGAWTQVQDAARFDHGWILPVFTGNSIGTRTSGQRFAGQVGVGSAGNEVPITPMQWWNSSASNFSMQFWPGWYVQVARGQRLSGRYGSNAVTTLGCGLAIYAGIR